MPEITGGQVFLIFILPVFLGIVTIVIIFVAKSFFHDTLIPMIYEAKRKVLGEHSVEGRWKAQTNPTYDPSRQYVETIHLSHRGKDVWGDIFYREVSTGNVDQEDLNLTEKHFEFTGTLVNEVLAATYYNTDRNSKGRGTFCLNSVDDDTLDGCYSWYEPRTKKIESGDYIWKRIRD